MDAATSNTPNSPLGSESTDQTKPTAIDDLANNAKYCVFAVSGGFFGYGYESTFPLTKSGKAVGHKETFDTVGGIYLTSRDTPYVYKQGEQEIDTAVDRSFDSIAVPPGVTVEIKNDSGALVNSTGKIVGPYMALSDAYQHISRAAVAGFLRGREAQMPPWMKKYLSEKNYLLDEITLHTARSVLVTKIANVSCDQY
jgi:hypothetical protein